MVELLVLATLAFSAFVVIAVLGSVFGMVLWLVFLPFRIIGWLFHGFAWLLAIPFVAVFALVAAVVLGAGMIMFLLPVLPFVLLALFAVWLVRRNQRSAATAAR
ncbi:MAG TPA: hypothetical protein VJY35_16005 [Candidatus Eisenbacteria bacterium]|nr:hypothetical protein [Candidatus Eisenbacteria bacterium]